MPSRFLSILTTPARLARHVAAETVWALDTAHVFGTRWGWHWVILDAEHGVAARHPEGKRWGWHREDQPQCGAGGWSLEVWVGPLYVVLDRDPRLAARGRLMPLS